MKLNLYVLVPLCIIILLIMGLASSIIFFPQHPPASMDAINAPIRPVDYSRLPPVSSYRARDGINLAYRAYPVSDAKLTAIIIHGSSGSSLSVHLLSEYLQAKGIDVYALDIRGHGQSGSRGDIDYIGQLEDDLEDFRTQMFHDGRRTVVIGFSSGGGFAMRFAASDRQSLFDQYVVLAPFIRHDSPTTRRTNDQWAEASVSRIIAISALQGAGERLLGHLPVIAFGTDPDTVEHQTASYSYRLWSNFGLQYDYQEDLKSIRSPLKVIVGENDELFYPQKYLELLAEAQPHAEIVIVPGVGHTTLTTSLAGVSAIVESLIEK